MTFKELHKGALSHIKGCAKYGHFEWMDSKYHINISVVNSGFVCSGSWAATSIIEEENTIVFDDRVKYDDQLSLVDVYRFIIKKSRDKKLDDEVVAIAINKNGSRTGTLSRDGDGRVEFVYSNNL